MNVERCELGKVTIETLSHQEACMLIGQRFTLRLVEQDPCRLQLLLKTKLKFYTSNSTYGSLQTCHSISLSATYIQHKKIPHRKK